MRFNPSTDAWRLFDPEIRRCHTSRSEYFYDNFKHRLDSLRRFRRKDIKRGRGQILLIRVMLLEMYIALWIQVTYRIQIRSLKVNIIP